MQITNLTDTELTVTSRADGARNAILAATVAAMAATVVGMVQENELMVIIGSAFVTLLYFAFIFCLEGMQATLDRSTGRVHVERNRRGNVVAEETAPFSAFLPQSGAGDPADALNHAFRGMARTWATGLAPRPDLAPTDAHRVLAWAQQGHSSA